jgi:transforming growth factor-beta-induced protein
MSRVTFPLALVLAVAVSAQFALAGDCKYSKAKHTPDIVDTAVAAGNFKTLAAALKAADLVETLKGKGPFTVFAPTDKAFGKLPKGTVEELLKPENKEKLTSILTYHVVPGRVMAADVVKLSEAKTVQGSKAKIRVTDGKVYVDEAQVTATDIKAGNGVIHVIDSVILPN